MKPESTEKQKNCYHCGNQCSDEKISSEEKFFCCTGCKTVFEILSEKKLCSYYDIDESAGLKIKNEKSETKFDYLDDLDVQEKLVDFKNADITSVTFDIPSIHCSSCIWLLENLNKFNNSIKSSRVNFLLKKITIIFKKDVPLKKVVSLLSELGYEPLISDNKVSEQKKNNGYIKSLYIKIGVAGFCLGNIMMFSFPEYLGISTGDFTELKTAFNYLCILLSLPVIFYCSSGFFISTWNSFKQKFISIDLPVSIGLTALFLRSLYEIIFFNNAGFMDSLAGLVFLLLVGKLFQSKTYESLNFERDYKSYFPVSVALKTGDTLSSIPLNKLKTGDRIIIRNNEIIPADAYLFSGAGNIDYSFVTGESYPERKVEGEIVYAGGRHTGSALELEVLKTVSQSYLTQLWNNEVFKKKTDNRLKSVTDSVSKYFTIVVLAIATAAAAYHWNNSIDLALNAFTAVLIVACPCALALTVPFALGNALRIFGKNKFYLKNFSVIESLSDTRKIVFDKTGTLTDSGKISAKYTGATLTEHELAIIKSSVKNSTHPLSRNIYESISALQTCIITDFVETINSGISCTAEGNKVKLGTLKFLFGEFECTFLNSSSEIKKIPFGTNVFVSINNQFKGFFTFQNKYRNGIDLTLKNLSCDYDISLISGDNKTDEKYLSQFFEAGTGLFFSKSPQDKLDYVKCLQKDSGKVLMIGDGLNDAGALMQSDIGISVSENVSNFSPACDIIMDASDFGKLPGLLAFSKSTMTIIKISFAISFIYNFIGLYVAASGMFSPMIAAILMPFNSISIILFVIFSTNFIAKRKKLL